MATVQTRSGKPIGLLVTAVTGNVLPLKLIPAPGETLPEAFTITPSMIARVTDVENHARANFTTFAIEALAPGRATLTVTARGKAATGPITIAVSRAIALPGANTDAGLLTRLILAETMTPMLAGSSGGDIPECMRLMRVVLENRLARPSARWSSAGARSLGDVVRARNQFEGFQAYPALSVGVAGSIDQLVALANNAADPRQQRMLEHIQLAISIATGPSPRDPTGGKLYWWRTQGAGAPGTEVSIYKSLVGNTFYKDK